MNSAMMALKKGGLPPRGSPWFRYEQRLLGRQVGALRRQRDHPVDVRQRVGRRCGKHLRLQLCPKRRQLQRGTRVVTLPNEREDRVELCEELRLSRRDVDSRLEVRSRERIDVGPHDAPVWRVL